MIRLFLFCKKIKVIVSNRPTYHYCDITVLYPSGYFIHCKLSSTEIVSYRFPTHSLNRKQSSSLSNCNDEIDSTKPYALQYLSKG